MVRQAGGPVFQLSLCIFCPPPPAKTVPRQRTTSRAEEIQVGTAGHTANEGSARGLDPSACQPSIRDAVLVHQRGVTLRYGWIWGL